MAVLFYFIVGLSDPKDQESIHFPCFSRTKCWIVRLGARRGGNCITIWIVVRWNKSHCSGTFSVRRLFQRSFAAAQPLPFKRRSAQQIFWVVLTVYFFRANPRVDLESSIRANPRVDLESSIRANPRVDLESSIRANLNAMHDGRFLVKLYVGHPADKHYFESNEIPGLQSPNYAVHCSHFCDSFVDERIAHSVAVQLTDPVRLDQV